MSRYIDADVLKNAIDNSEYMSAYDAIIAMEIIDKQLPADVRENVHGEWIDIWDKNDTNTSSNARCSICKRESKRPVGHFCKWCGTDMRGEEE